MSGAGLSVGAAVEAADVPARLAEELAADPRVDDLEAFARALVAVRKRFGITRVGSLTRLDDCGVHVVQAVRPGSESLVAAQGKGVSLAAATVSALMEAIERRSAERIAPPRIRSLRAAELDDALRRLLARARVSFDPAWDRLPLPFIDGWDLFAGRVAPVPLALVDARYVLPSPHPAGFPRTTTGLAAARTLTDAVVRAGLEVIERHAVASAGEGRRVASGSVRGAAAGEVLHRLRERDFVVGIWRLAAPLPVYRCHVMEGEGRRELAPRPGEGTACGLTADAALAAALTEAASARLTAIAGAREDIVADAYGAPDRTGLAAWRAAIAQGGADDEAGCDAAPADALPAVLAALASAGAGAAIVVSLAVDLPPGVCTVRLVAPPLRHPPAH